jgi:hypothetical protein
MTLEEKLEHHSALTNELHRAYSLMAFLPGVYKGECARVSIGFKFSKDGKRFSRNRFNQLSMRESPRSFFRHSIAVISRKDKNGNVIEEIERPANTLPHDHLPEFWKNLKN